MSAPQQMMVGGRSWLTLSEAINEAALTGNLKLALDVGDAASYTSGQKWLDQSGNGYDFFLGADAGATGDPSTSPSFAAGKKSAYFSTGGTGAYFKYDAANETWMNNLHKNGAAFTIFAVVYVDGGDVNPRTVCCATQAFGGSAGIFLESGTNYVNFQVIGASGTVLSKAGLGGSIPGGYPGWHFVALSLDEAVGAGGGFFYANGAYAQVSGSDTFDSTYVSPSAAAASMVMRLLNDDSGTSGSNSRIAMFAAWDVAMGKAAIDRLYYRLLNRYSA